MIYTISTVWQKRIYYLSKSALKYVQPTICQQFTNFYSLCEYLNRTLIQDAAVLSRKLFPCHTRYKLSAGASLLTIFSLQDRTECQNLIRNSVVVEYSI